MRTPGRTRPSYCMAPCVQGAGADADGEQDAQDERGAEAEGERPSTPRSCGGLAVGHGGHDGQRRHGIDAGLEDRRRVRWRDVDRLARRRRLGDRHIGRRGLGVDPRCAALDEGRELGVAGGRLAVGCGGVGSPVGCGVGQVGHQVLMRAQLAPGLGPGSRDILARARQSVTVTFGRVPRTVTRVALRTLRGVPGPQSADIAASRRVVAVA